MAKIDDFFNKLAKYNGSDLHIRSGFAPMIRLQGKMIPMAQEIISPEQVEELLMEIIPENYKEQFLKTRDVDFSYSTVDKVRLRVNYFWDRFGMGGVFRLIPSKLKSAEELGLSPAIIDLCKLSKGLVLVTGPTGCGKSTTMASMVDYVNTNRTDHIITIEDPLEFIHNTKKCLITQREVHTHTESFASALRAALREDPDIVLVGELRDLETTQIALETAETGHLVFATLHTSTAASTIDRVIDQFPADRQDQIRTMLSASLVGVVSQSLMRRQDGKGMVPAWELLIMTQGARSLIRDKKAFQIGSLIETGQEQGMILLNESIERLVRKNIVSPKEAFFKCVDKEDMRRRLAQIQAAARPPVPAHHP